MGICESHIFFIFFFFSDFVFYFIYTPTVRVRAAGHPGQMCTIAVCRTRFYPLDKQLMDFSTADGRHKRRKEDNNADNAQIVDISPTVF